MTVSPLHPTHPVSGCLQELTESLSRVAGADPSWMSVDAKREALLTLGRLSAQLESLRMSVIAASGDLADLEAARSVSAWLELRTHGSPAADRRAERLGLALAHRWHRVSYALSEGLLSVAQSEVIVRALDNLDSDVPPELKARAEQHLVELGEEFGPQQLRALGNAILERIAPDDYDDEERKKLEEAERRASAATRMSIRRRGDGSADVHARVPEAFAARLQEYLHAFTSPRHENAAGGAAPAPLLDPATGDRLPHDRRLGLAFCALLEAVDPAAMPLRAGAPTTLVITMAWSDLQAGTGAATLPDGTRISAGEARRQACNAGILPAVLGGASEVLDLGRTRRLFTGKQRLALSLADPHCRAEGCTVPASWCEAHHAGDPWSRGGRTDLREGRLLCPHHHRRVHDEQYRSRLLPNGDVRFRRRP